LRSDFATTAVCFDPIKLKPAMLYWRLHRERVYSRGAWERNSGREIEVLIFSVTDFSA
jgi:hypothetical protein